jgi:cold shock CspA family protein
MARSKETFSKKEKEKLKAKKKKEKLIRSEERKSNAGGGGLDSMMAYVDEFGRIVDAPVDPSSRIEIDAESIEIGIPRREESDEDEASDSGTVIFFNDSKGYGFIKDKASGENIFVHAINLSAPIAERDEVKFDKSRGQKGWEALNVKIIPKDTSSLT